MFLTLLLSGIFFLTTVSSEMILQYFERKPQITVFFSDTATDGDIEEAKKMLNGSGKVDNLKFVSKEEALTIYKEQNKNDPLLLEMVTADILPASLEVTAKDPSFLSELAPQLQSTHGVEEVVYQKDVVETLIRWSNAIRNAVGILAILLGVNAILVLMTITTMKISLKRDEVEILRLVGASRWYIRSPFLWEGAIYGLIGAVLSWVIIIAVTVWQRQMLLGFVGMIPQIYAVLSNPAGTLFLISSAAFFGCLAFVGMLLGIIGSYISVNRYLNV